MVDEVKVAREEHQKHFALYTIDDELSNVLFSLIAMKGDWDSSEKVYMNEMRQDEQHNVMERKIAAFSIDSEELPMQENLYYMSTCRH